MKTESMITTKQNIMGSIIIRRGMKIVRTPEQVAELKALALMTDDDIDYSDIPPLTDEELARMKPARLREKNLKKVSS